MKKRTQIPRSMTESGYFPKPDLTLFTPKELPEPTAQPEAVDSDSTTEITSGAREGEDRAKNRDDSASGHASRASGLKSRWQTPVAENSLRRRLCVIVSLDELHKTPHPLTPSPTQAGRGGRSLVIVPHPV